MNDAAAHREANALAQILDQLSALHGSMTEVISRKIEQMRRADMEGMRDSAAKEQALLERINERDGRRASPPAAVNAAEAVVFQRHDRFAVGRCPAVRTASTAKRVS